MADLAIDPQFEQERDDESAYGSDLQSYTTSLASAATDFKFVNGRRYHSYEEGRYVFPNDEEEKDRLDIMHQVVRLALDDKLFTAPIKSPGRILDIGTGTGIWAIEAADMFPQADVMGNDLSPIQPRWVPPNVSFEVDDIEKPWTFAKPFDFIHCRGLYGALRDYYAMIKQCYDHMNPGGWLEISDWDNLLTSPDGSIDGTNFKRFNRTIAEQLVKGGVEAHPGPKLVQWFKDAGFTDVKERVIFLPFGTWPKDEKMKKIGAWNYLQMDTGLEGYATYSLNKEGWSKQEIDVFCAKVRHELKDRRMHAMLPMHNVIGRKPE